MNTIALYQPPARWPIGLSLLAAITIETAAIGLAGLHRVEEIPFAGGISSPPIVADFIPDPADPAPPEATPPVMPPAPETPTEFSLVEPAAPLQPPSHATASLTRSSRPQTASFAAAGARLTNAPVPAYPYEARRAHRTGSGVFVLRFDDAGAVTEVGIERSTGSAVLDQAACNSFRRWRCAPGTYRAVRVPVSFTLAGAQL